MLFIISSQLARHEKTDLVAGADDPAVAVVTVVAVPAPVRLGEAPTATVVPAAPPAASSPPTSRPSLVALAGSPAAVAAQPGSVARAGARVPGSLTAQLLLQIREISGAKTSPVKLTGG